MGWAMFGLLLSGYKYASSPLLSILAPFSALSLLTTLSLPGPSVEGDALLCRLIQNDPM